MEYKINTEKLSHPLLKPLLVDLQSCFSPENIHFYVIGATARDIIMEIHNETSGRLTHDLDIAIAVNNWEEYKKIENLLITSGLFEKDTNQKQRFLYNKTFQIDIVPYGDIMREDSKIYWPPTEDFAMSVLGFNEVASATQKIVIDQDLEIEVANLSGIFLLKIFAWKDRAKKGNKDADDMCFIMANYLSIHQIEAVEFYTEIYEVSDFSEIAAGAKILGKHLWQILEESPQVKKEVIKIIKRELDIEEESLLINQIMETNRIYPYEQVVACFVNIVKEIEK